MPVNRFWDVIDKSDDEGEIILHGDVESAQPTDWWTGEPIPGEFITPEGFAEDLEKVKNKSKITVKLNSCGGDLYTGIAIHNTLKALSANINVIVEGIAASAASVIMCAGDTVSVFPGSLVMIHGVSAFLFGGYTVGDLEKSLKGMIAAEDAIANIYSVKTGRDIDELKRMITDETWMTGDQAIELGFADEMVEGAEDAAFSLQNDGKLLLVNGVSHSTAGMRNIPKTIPVLNTAQNRQPTQADDVDIERKEIDSMDDFTLETLQAECPALVDQIRETERQAMAAEIENAVSAERERIAEIDSIAAALGDTELVNEAKYGENRCDARELSFRALQKNARQGTQFLADFAKDSAESGANDVTAQPNGGGAEVDDNNARMADIVSAYRNSKEGN